MARPDVRLAILDEPARGLDREARRSLLARARQHFAKATMIFVTHDVPEPSTSSASWWSSRGGLSNKVRRSSCTRKQILGTARYAIRKRSLASAYGQDRRGGT